MRREAMERRKDGMEWEKLVNLREEKYFSSLEKCFYRLSSQSKIQDPGPESRVVSRVHTASSARREVSSPFEIFQLK